jgi:plasmid stability protein
LHDAARSFVNRIESVLTVFSFFTCFLYVGATSRSRYGDHRPEASFKVDVEEISLTEIQYGSILAPTLNRRYDMPVNLSIKNVPEDIADSLRKRATKNHRSLQGELMAIIEEAVGRKSLQSPSDLLTKVRALGLRTPTESRSMIREDRDAR